MNDMIVDVMNNGGAIGVGAGSGVAIFVMIVKSYFKEVSATLKEIQGTLDRLARDHEVAQAKTNLEIMFLKDKISQMDERLKKIEG